MFDAPGAFCARKSLHNRPSAAASGSRLPIAVPLRPVKPLPTRFPADHTKNPAVMPDRLKQSAPFEDFFAAAKSPLLPLPAKNPAI